MQIGKKSWHRTWAIRGRTNGSWFFGLCLWFSVLFQAWWNMSQQGSPLWRRLQNGTELRGESLSQLHLDIGQSMDYLTKRDLEEIGDWIKVHEGCELLPYEDTAVPPRITIGYGRNLSDVGISQEEADILFNSDLKVALEECEEFYWGFSDYPQEVKIVLVDLMFNMGRPTMEGFVKFNQALKEDNYRECAKELEHSRYYHQTGRRAQRNIDLLLEASNKYQL